MSVRENVAFRVMYTESSFPISLIVNFLNTKQKNKKSGIVYSLNESDCQVLMKELLKNDVRYVHHQVPLTDEQKSWLKSVNNEGVNFI